MEELRLGAAASVDRGLDPAKWCKIHMYISMLHLKSRLVFSRGSSTIRILSRYPILTINESLLRHQNSETPQGILPLPRHLPD